MTSERWQQIDQLFHSALECPPGERDTFLTQACNGDESLQKEIELLIASHEQSDNFIEGTAADIAAELLARSKGQLTAGESIGHYEIVSLLGEGGMGEVYLARDVRLGRQVALKRLPAQFTLDAERVHRFEQEACAASALNHPNIITIHEIGRSNATHFITTEFIDGETLRHHMTRGGIKLDQAVDIATQVASALVAAHEAGIVHRDIKPENIMVRRDCIVKVLDFGLAKLSSNGAKAMSSQTSMKEELKTDPGMVMGTAQYMSPEQARGENVDHRTDIWSLGVVLYEMVVGHVPFIGETPSHVIVSILEGEPSPIQSYVEVPTELERLVVKALRKKRDERYQTASDLAHDLKGLSGELEMEARLKRMMKPDERQKRTSASAVSTSALVQVPPTLRAKNLFTEIKRRKTLAVLILLLVGASGLSYYFGTKGNKTNFSGSTSIAVLPFINETGDPNVEYVSDGVTEALISNLSQLPKLKVTARSSAFKYKGKKVDLREAARSLNVETILTGRVTQRGDNLSISVELLDARDARHMWRERYNRKASDLLRVQAEICHDIAQALSQSLSPAKQQQLAKHETVIPEAYELLLKGRFYRNKGTTEDSQKALRYFNQATAADPTYALAYAELSRTYSSLINSNMIDPKEFMSIAVGTARRALELDTDLAEAHLAMARVKSNAWDWAEAEREIKRAIQLNPNLAWAHREYAFFLIIKRRAEEALAEAERARELDPLSIDSNAVVVYGLLLTQQTDRAIEIVKRMFELDANNPQLHTLLAQIYTWRGQHSEAVAAWQEVIRLGDRSPDAQILLGTAYASAGQPENTQAILKRLEKGKEYVSPAAMALLHAAIREREKALSLLESAFSTHDQQLIWLGVEPGFDPLRSDPRFDELMKRVGLK